MNTHSLIHLAALALTPVVSSATLTQSFETPEDTVPQWNSTWTDGTTTPGFLSSTLGGSQSGGGASSNQSFSRMFRDNMVGLDTQFPYTIGMYVQVDAFDGAAGGLFEIIDGKYGSENAANLRIETTGDSTSGYTYNWQARDGGSWTNLGISLELSTPYFVQLNVNPQALTYSALVQQVDSGGSVIGSAGVNDIGFDPNVITNNDNGELRFYIQASAGGTDVRVDNINIVGVPEPSTLFITSAAALFGLGRRRRTDSGTC